MINTKCVQMYYDSVRLLQHDTLPFAKMDYRYIVLFLPGERFNQSALDQQDFDRGKIDWNNSDESF